TAPGMRSIQNSMSQDGGKPDKSSRNIKELTYNKDVFEFQLVHFHGL
ncbi:hypothetical protein Tco_0621449, partial [Tanacetum coccineum]